MGRFSKSAGGASGKSFVGFMVMFGSIWTLLVGAVDAFVVYGTVMQVRAESYTPVPATIVSSRVDRDTSGEGTTYGAEIVYTYEVDGRVYESDRIAYGLWSSSDASEARAYVRRFPAGEAATAYHRPGDPAESVLVRGMQGQNYFLMLFLTPFNAVALGIWYSVAMAALVHRLHPRGGLGLRRSGTTARLQIGRWSVVYAFLGGTGLTGFASIFLVAFVFGTSDAEVARGALLAAPSVGVVSAFVALWRNMLRGSSLDVVIDRAAGTVTLPERKGRRAEALTLPMASIRGIGRNASTDESTTSVNSRLVMMHTPTIVYDHPEDARGDGGGGDRVRRARVVNWTDRARSERLLAWLASELRVPVLDDEPGEARAPAGTGGDRSPASGPGTAEAGSSADAGVVVAGVLGAVVGQRRASGAGDWLEAEVERPAGMPSEARPRAEAAVRSDRPGRDARADRRVRLGSAESARRAANAVPRAASTTAGAIGLFFLGAFWNGIIGTFLVLITAGVIDAAAQRAWPTVDATVTASRVHRDSEDADRPAIELAYTVDGEAFSLSTLDDNGGFTFHTDAHARAMVHAHPVGAVVPLHVDPDDPARGALDPLGGLGMVPFMLGFLAPFLVIGAALWSPIILAIGRLIVPSWRDRVRIDERGRRVVVRLGSVGAPLGFAGGAAVAGFVGAFAFGGVLAVTDAGSWVGSVYLGVVVSAGLLGAVLAARRRARGDADLVVDTHLERVHPPAKKRKTGMPGMTGWIAASDVLGVLVRARHKTDGDGDRVTRHVVELELAASGTTSGSDSGTERGGAVMDRVRLTDDSDQTKADAIAVAVASLLGVEARGLSASSTPGLASD